MVQPMINVVLDVDDVVLSFSSYFVLIFAVVTDRFGKYPLPILSQCYRYLVGGLEHEFKTFHILGIIIIPTEELIFFIGVGIPPTRYIYIYM